MYTQSSSLKLCLNLRIVSQIWSCFQNQNWTNVAQTATILVCVIEFLRQTEQVGWLIVSFFWGLGGIFTAFLLTVHQKALYRRPWLRSGGYLGKNLNCVTTRAYLDNIRISKHSQDKSRELHIFCQLLAVLCFELLGFENPRSDWT
jgi:hypothetical protein